MSLHERVLYVGGAGYGEFGGVQADHVLLITRTIARGSQRNQHDH
jgi:hypothetical protein